MPETTITIDREQRDGLYELIRNHVGSVGDLWHALEQAGDFAKAEQLGREFAEDFRLLADIGWDESEQRESFTLTMQPRELIEALLRFQSEAGTILLGSDESEEDAETVTTFRRGWAACEAVLTRIDRPGLGTAEVHELAPYSPVEDLVILAAAERAALHEGEEEVLTAVLAEHLGFDPVPNTNRHLWPRLEELRRAGLLTATERRGEPFWSLTAIGREELASAREEGGVGELPEAPQHRAWRHARVEAAVRIEGFKEELTHAVEAADALINQYRPAMSAEWFELSERLRFTSWRLASAAYCLTEWPEPDDASPDRDENPGPDPGRRAVKAWNRHIESKERA